MVWNKHHKLVITQANKSPVCGEDEISRTTVFGLWQISDVTYGGGGGGGLRREEEEEIVQHLHII